jgi:hypothetical protein
VAGSSTAAPKAAIMAATIKCFIECLHCEASWALDAQLAPLTNQSGEFLTKGRVFVDGAEPAKKGLALPLHAHGCHAAPAVQGNAILPGLRANLDELKPHNVNKRGELPCLAE